MRIEVNMFAIDTKVTIKMWIVLIKTYFEISRLKPKTYVELMFRTIAHPFLSLQEFEIFWF